MLFASPTEWQDPGNTVANSGRLQPHLHVAHLCQSTCCLELFGCCCRRLSQHGLGEVLILRRHCWPDAFFLRLRWQWIVLSRLGVALLSFVFVF